MNASVRTFRQNQFGAAGVSARSVKPPAIYPAAVATDSDLTIAVDRLQTRLALPMNTGDTSMTVIDPSLIGAYNLLSIDGEIVKTTGPPVGNVVPVARGFDGTTPAVHLASAVVSGFIDAYHHNRLAAEVGAIEAALGPNLSNIPGNQLAFSTAYDFPAQTPGGTLTPGNNVIILSPVPPGVNGTDTNHWLYISGGTGTAECGLITGGTAVAGAPSGTVIVNCANAHSGAWTIRSANRGIREAIIGLPAGSLLAMPPGTLAVSHIVIDRNISLRGQSPGGTILVPLTAEGPYVMTIHPPTVLGGLEISNFTVDMTGFPLLSGINVQNVSQSQLSDIIIVGGTNGIVLSGPTVDTPSVVYATFRNLTIRNCTGVGFLQDGDRCWENYYDNISIQLDSATSDMAAGFKVTRTTNTTFGAYYLFRVHVNRVSARTLTNGIVFTCSALAELDIFLTECLADGINGDALQLINVIRCTAVNGWFASTGTGSTGSAVLLNHTAEATFIGNQILAENGSGFHYVAGPTAIHIAHNVFSAIGQFIHFFSGGADQPTNLIFGNNTNNGIPMTNDGNLIFGTAQFYNPHSGLQVWTNPTGIGPDLLDIFDPLNSIHAPLRNATGVLQLLNSAGSQVNWSADQSGNFITQTYNYIPVTTGLPNQISGSLVGRILSAGLIVRILLAHTLQAGVNAFILNGGPQKAIKSSRNPANNIGTAYAVGGVITMMYDGTQWLDLSQ